MSRFFPELQWRWTLGRKIGSLAAMLLLILAGVSTYSHLEIKEVSREIEEIGESDFPLYDTTYQIRLSLLQKVSLLEEINILVQSSPKDFRLNERIQDFQHRRDDMLAKLQTGDRQLKYALQQEQLKEGSLRLNQANEDYEHLYQLFTDIQLKNQDFDQIVYQILEQVSAEAVYGRADLLRQAKQELAEIDRILIIIQISLQNHIHGSVNATKTEEFVALTTNSIIALIGILVGVMISSLVIQRITRTVNQVTQKAQQIADNIAQNCFPTEQLSVESTDEVADLTIAFNQMVNNFRRCREECQRIEAHLFQEKELAQITLHSIADAVITTHADGRIAELNLIAERLTGWSRDAAIGLPLSQVFQVTDIDQRQPLKLNISQYLQEPSQNFNPPSEVILLNDQKQEFWVSLSISQIRNKDSHSIGAVIVCHDVTKERHITQQLNWQACHDPLTELLNRRAFERQLAESLRDQGCGEAREHILFYFDLDRFKIVNDTCGHAAGDELLKQVASLLQSQVRDSDTIARLGGDEFAAILYNCSLTSALEVAQGLLKSIQNFRFVWCDKSFTIGVSIGVVPYHPQHDSLADLMKAADTACYAAKKQGRNQVYVVQDKQQTLAQQSREMNWIARIHQALEADQFCLYYQSIAPLQHKQNTGEHYEVLIRLRDTDDSLIPPMAIIPTAERYGLMRQIDRWVIHTLFKTQGVHYRKQYHRCQSRPDHQATYGINLSGETLNDEHFVDFLQAELDRYQIPPQVLCFEITETVAISNLNRVKVLMEQLRSLGCRFALDDFGVGMSSFGYLKHLPVDYIKIDGSFVQDLLSNLVNTAIVQAIGQVAYAMGIATVAEFVEDEQVMQKLRTLGIDYGQGYGIARPKPLPTLRVVSSQFTPNYQESVPVNRNNSSQDWDSIRRFLPLENGC